MSIYRLLSLCVIACLFTFGGGVRADDLPEDARKVLDDLDKRVEAIQKRADEEVRGPLVKCVEALQKLQDAYTRAGKLDEALAIRERVRELTVEMVGAQPEPDTLTTFRGQINKVLFFEVTGRQDGSVWGTGVYTDDSDLSTAAVHAGLLREGQKGIVRVTILDGQNAYRGSTQNGIASYDYRNWPGSYRVEAVTISPQRKAVGRVVLPLRAKIKRPAARTTGVTRELLR